MYSVEFSQIKRGAVGGDTHTFHLKTFLEDTES